MRIIFIAVLFLHAAGAYSQNCGCPPVSVAVRDFDNTAAKPAWYHGGSLNEYNKQQVIEIADWQHASQQGAGGFLESSRSLNKGQVEFKDPAFKTDYVVTGQFTRAGDHYLLQVRVEDARSGERFGEQSVSLAGLQTAIEAGKEAAGKLSPLLSVIRKYQHYVRDEKNKDATAISAEYELTADKKVLDAGATTGLRLKMYDCDDHSPLKHRTVTLKVTEGKSTVSPSTVTTDGNGEAHVTFQAAKQAETAEVIAEYQYTTVDNRKNSYANSCGANPTIRVGSHYKLKVAFEARGHGDEGGRYHALVTGEADVQWRLENDQYVVEASNGGQMEFKVEEVVFSSDQGRAVYVAPHSFKSPVTLSLSKGNSPVFTIAFGSFGDPQETYSTSGGANFQAPLLYSLAMATLGSVNMGRMQSEQQNMQQKAEPFKGKEAEVDAAAKRLNEHQNDPNYINSAQGKADMALMKQMAKDMGYGDMKGYRPDPGRMQNLDNLKAMNAAQEKINKKLPTPGYMASPEYQSDLAELNRLKARVNMNQLTQTAGFDMNMLRIEAPFTIGSDRPVDKTQQDKIAEVAGSKGGWEFGQFHVTVENF